MQRVWRSNCTGRDWKWGKKVYTCCSLAKAGQSPHHLPTPKTQNYIFQTPQRQYFRFFKFKNACNQPEKLDYCHTLLYSLIQIYQGNSPVGKHIFVQRGVPHSMLWRRASSRYTACCWAQGAMEGRGKERVMLLLTRHKQYSKKKTKTKKTLPKRSAFNWNTWMRKVKINKLKSAGEDSGRHPWT